jgi:large-conductance mechanosensitive channel
MREHIDRLLAQASIVTLALGVAIGWSLFQVARGVADVVQGLLTKNPDGLQFTAYQNSQPATWIVGGRVLTFTTLISGIVELAIMLLVAALIARRTALRTR